MKTVDMNRTALEWLHGIGMKFEDAVEIYLVALVMDEDVCSYEDALSVVGDFFWGMEPGILQDVMCRKVRQQGLLTSPKNLCQRIVDVWEGALDDYSRPSLPADLEEDGEGWALD